MEADRQHDWMWRAGEPVGDARYTGGHAFSAIAAHRRRKRNVRLEEFKFEMDPETSSRNNAMWQKQDSSRFQRDDPILETCRSFRPKIPARRSDSGNFRKIPAADSSTVGNLRKFQA